VSDWRREIGNAAVTANEIYGVAVEWRDVDGRPVRIPVNRDVGLAILGAAPWLSNSR